MPELPSDFLMQLRVDFDAPVSLPDAPLGTRRVLYAKEGSFAGSGLEGKVLRGGGDWVLLRRDGVAELDIRFTLQTSDAQLICLNARGLFHDAYFRTSFLFETGAEKYRRLNRLLAVGIGQRTAGGMVTDLFEVK